MKTQNITVKINTLFVQILACRNFGGFGGWPEIPPKLVQANFKSVSPIIKWIPAKIAFSSTAKINSSKKPSKFLLCLTKKICLLSKNMSAKLIANELWVVLEGLIFVFLQNKHVKHKKNQLLTSANYLIGENFGGVNFCREVTKFLLISLLSHKRTFSSGTNIRH